MFEQCHGTKVTKRHDLSQTPHQRAIAHPGIRKMPIIRMNAESKIIKPAALLWHILALTGRLEALALAKEASPAKPVADHAWDS